MLQEALSPLRAQPQAELNHTAPAQACALLFCISGLCPFSGAGTGTGARARQARTAQEVVPRHQKDAGNLFFSSAYLSPASYREPNFQLPSLLPSPPKEGGKQEAIGLSYSAHARGCPSSGWPLLPSEHCSSPCQCQEDEGVQDPARQQRPAPPPALGQGHEAAAVVWNRGSGGPGSPPTPTKLSPSSESPTQTAQGQERSRSARTWAAGRKGGWHQQVARNHRYR